MPTLNGINVDEHLGLATLAAARLASVLRCEVDELLGDAYIALHDAARTFDPSKGYKFSTHAVKALRFRLYAKTMSDLGRVRINKKWTRPLGFMECGEAVERAPAQPEVNREEHEEEVRRMIDEVLDVAESISPNTRRVMRERIKHETDGQAAAHLGLSRERVRQVVQCVSEAMQGREDAVPPFVAAEQLDSRGVSVIQAAKALGVPRQRVYKMRYKTDELAAKCDGKAVR